LFVGRTTESKQLEDYYGVDRNNLIILYGRSNIGKTKLILEFTKGKPCFYYAAREASEKEQLLHMQEEVKEQLLHMQEEVREQLLYMQEEVIAQSSIKIEYLDYYHILEAAVLNIRTSSTNDSKTIIVIDEFHHIIKNSNEFVTAFTRLLAQQERFGKVMIILCSSSVNWVENDMVSSLGLAARNISAFLKLKEFTFMDFVNRFPNSSVEQCVYINGVLGGVPGYLEEWSEVLSVEDNIKKIILNTNGKLHNEAEHFLKSELRELSLYNTILATLSKGKIKLNDIHNRTGFSRAKISVYIKNLIQLDIAEKTFSYGTTGRENTLKGLYRIKDNYINFWYRYVFPNLSLLKKQQVDLVYETKVKPDLNEYMKEYFVSTCTECLKLMNTYHRLPYEYENWGSWFGKNGNIDIIAEDKTGKTLVGSCLWLDQAMEMPDYSHFKELIEQARIEPEHYYLFSKNGFSKELEELAIKSKYIKLIPLEELQ